MAGLVALTLQVQAQSPPVTDIFLVDVEFRAGTFTFGKPMNITNRAGYDNQPSFTPDNTGLLYTSYRFGQTDIYRYHRADGTTVQVTDTPESEYSPTVMPGGNTFSAVRVEADSTQRLWQFSMDGTDPKLVLPDVQPVGYHAWGDKNTVAMFVLGNPITFQIADMPTQQTQLAQDFIEQEDGADYLVPITNIGRSLQKLPRARAISFIRKYAEDRWTIERYDVRTGRISPLVDALAGVEDHAWYPKGPYLLMGKGAKLYAWEPAFEDWQEVADFTDEFNEAGIKNISRLAVSPDGTKLALVSSR